MNRLVMDKLEVIYNILPETGATAFEKPELAAKDRNKLEADLAEISSLIECKSENIGAGADWIVVVATLAGLFFLGDKVNKNLDAWKAISKKFVRLFKKTNIAFVDGNGVRLIAIERILANEETVESIEEVAFNEINLHSLNEAFKDGRTPDQLISKPFSYYNMIYRVNNRYYYIISIKSDGKLRTADKIEDGEYGFNKNFDLDV